MPGQTGPALFVLQGQHGSVRFWPGTIQFDLQCKRSRQQEASWQEGTMTGYIKMQEEATDYLGIKPPKQP